MAVRIICIKKDDGDHENPYVAIDHLEWVNDRIKVNGITDRTKIHDWIKNRLVGQPRWKSPHSGVPKEGEFREADRTEEFRRHRVCNL